MRTRPTSHPTSPSSISTGRLVTASTCLLAVLAVLAPIGAMVLTVAPTPAGAATQSAQSDSFTNPAWADSPAWKFTADDDGDPIALSSPIPATIDGTPSVVVGDRRGYVYALPLADGNQALPGWPVTNGSGPVDSTPSVSTSGGQTTVYYGSGNDADPTTGGYQAFSSSGSQLWFSSPTNPATDQEPDVGVQAGLSVGSLQGGGTDVVAGSLGQQAYALDAANGATLTGWPFFDSDSTHSTAALADLYGNGQTETIVGGDQTAGTGQGQTYTNGGHLRILSGNGNQICRADTNQVVDSSPAVGGFLAGGATGIVVGTGDYFSGASDTGTVKAYDTHCNLQWSATLDGSTYSSPALADILGNGSLQVAEGTDNGTTGSVWVLNGATGQTIWKEAVPGRVIGSVVTADLFDQGYQDVIVPTTAGTEIFDGKTGDLVAQLTTPAAAVGLQNSPLVTDDPNGTVGITIAGISGNVAGGVGVVWHYEIPGSNGAEAVGAGSWPMFHHDPQLTGDAGGTTPQGSVPACDVPAAADTGYNLVAADGGVFSFGGTPFCGSTGSLHLNAPIVGTAMAPSVGGYWFVASDGGVFAYGGAQFYGSMGGKPLNAPIVGMAATPDGKGYWLVAADGGIFAYGDAQFYGSMGGLPLNKPIVGIASSTDGNGYRLVASDGGIFAYGDAQFLGSMGGRPLNQPVVGLVNDTNTGGYWEVAADGGVFAFGGAPFYGSTGGITLNKPIVGMAETSNGSGYRFVASDGGVFSYGAPFYGSMGGQPLNEPIVGMAGF